MKDIPGYEGLYAITRNGRVWGYPKMHGNRAWGGRFLLNNQRSRRGHLKIILYGDDGGHKHWVHRLVARTYIPNPAQLPEVNHRNGVPSDNRVSNLEWVTHKENMMHASKMGRLNHHPHNKLNEQLASEIRDRVLRGETTRVLSKEFDVSGATVRNVVRGETWSYAVGTREMKRLARR